MDIFSGDILVYALSTAGMARNNSGFRCERRQPTFEGRFNREAHLLGYGDVFEAANALCELNVRSNRIGAAISPFSFPCLWTSRRFVSTHPESGSMLKFSDIGFFQIFGLWLVSVGTLFLQTRRFENRFPFRPMPRMTDLPKLFRRRALYRFET